MKNTEKYNVANVIYMTLDEFKELVTLLTDGLEEVEYESGVYIVHSEKAEETETYIQRSMTEILSDYFETEVMSFHSDTKEYPMVYICCRK